MSVPPRRTAMPAVAIMLATCAMLVRTSAVAPPRETFDELYARGQRANAAVKTLTARFTETTSSTLLTRPIVAHGRLAVERPARVILRYTDPDARVVLIDGKTMTMTWPSRKMKQSMDIGATQGRIQKYFVNGTAADLRQQFDIEDRGSDSGGSNGDHAGMYAVSLIPKRKQIREALARLDLWVDRTSLLLSTMTITFANGDVKTMAFEDVVPNAPLDAGTFTLDR